jgi:ribose transport system ATP-binding protein
MSAIAKRFGSTVALEGVDLAVERGEIHALIGENGAGKSTLMKVLAGAVRADAGTIEIDGRPFAPSSPADARDAGVAMIFQELSLAPHLSVAENIALGREPHVGPFVARRELERTARAALERVGHGELDLRRRVADLSLGDRQLVEIARALSSQARVLVLDEPTSSLTAPDTARLHEVLRALAQQGTAIVYISHVLDDVFAIARRFTVLRDGRVATSGELADATVAGIVTAMVGREVSELYPRSEREPGEVVVRLMGAGSACGLRDATLELRRGEVLGIAGLQGAGRSELVRAIFGLDRVVRGEVRVLALDGAREPDERWRQHVGFLSEDRKRDGLALLRSVADNLMLPSTRSHARLGCVSPSAVERAAQPWIERLRIRCASPGARVASLSGGNQQKVALARLLAAECDVLLLDEPTRGVDVGAKAEIYDWIDQLVHRDERARAAIVVSSYLPELFGICDRIAVMARGELGPSRACDETDEHAVMLEATRRGAS